VHAALAALAALTFDNIVTAPLLALYAACLCGVIATKPEMDDTNKICFPRFTALSPLSEVMSRDEEVPVPSTGMGRESQDRTSARER
jgi:hypothetical protein